MKSVRILLLAVATLCALIALCACGGGADNTPEHTHSFGDWKVTEKPTCTEKGTETRYCSCGEKQTEVIVELGHNYIDGECANCGDIKENPECKHDNVEVLSAKASTCTENGLTEGKKCLDCGEILIAQTETAMLAHAFGDWVTVKESTITEEGLQERTCACGEKETQKIDKCPVTYSKGLEFTLNDDDQSYTVTGIGTCTDTDVFIPNTYEGLPVTSIGYRAFDGCTGLTSIEIPDSVTSIGSYAFEDCTGLTSIVIPDSVTSIGRDAFSGCTGLTSIEIPDSVTSIGNSAFYNCTGLTSIVIPDSVTIIDDYAFEDCTGLTSIVIGDSVTWIGEAAFYYCTGLTSIVIPDSVEMIGLYAFAFCSNLSEITLGESLRAIGDRAFSGCTGLTSIEIPDSVTNIGNGAFRYCIGLISIEIPDGVTSIGREAFYGCTGLTSIEIGDGVTSIDYVAFYGCTGLTSITVDKNNTEYKSIDGNLYTKDGKTLIQYAIGKKNTSFTIPDSVTSISDYAFYNCTGLTSIKIGDGVTSVGEGAFYNCTGLTSIVIPDSVTSIGWYAFRSCTGLTDVYYTGTVAEWAKISIDYDYDNDYLTNATIHYNYVPAN